MISVAARSAPAVGAIAASYERVSTQRQSEGFSLQTQARTAEQLAADNGWTLPNHLRFVDGQDADASGADWSLPALNAMLEAAREGTFQVLICPHTDRFGRDLVKSLVLEQELAKAGVAVHYGNVPSADGSPESRLLRNQLHSFSEYERERIRLRTTVNRRSKAAAGLFVGNGPPPYGYRFVRGGAPKRRVVGLEVVDSEARVIRQLYARIEHESITAILRWLDGQLALDPVAYATPGQARGIKSGAQRWSPRTVWTILHSSTYTGCFEWSGLQIAVPPIVDVATAERARKNLAERRARASGWRRKWEGVEGGDPYLLRGILECGFCAERGHDVGFNTRMLSMARRPNRYYTCSRKFDGRKQPAPLGADRCTLPSLAADLIEEHVWQLVAEQLLNPQSLRAALETSRELRQAADADFVDHASRLEARIEKQAKQLERCVQRISALDPDDDGDREELAALQVGRDQLKQSLATLRRERADLDGHREPTGLSDAEVDELTRFAGDIAAGVKYANASERRRVLQLLRLRGRVLTGDDVIVSKKPVRHVSIEWTGELRLDARSCEYRFKKLDISFAPLTRLSTKES